MNPTNPASPSALPEALAQRVVDLSRLTSGLAHEIRNPLSTLKMNLQLLEEDWRQVESPQDDKDVDPKDIARRSRKRIATLLTETRRLESILDDFVQFVRGRRLNPIPCDLNHLVETLADFYRPQAEAHGIELQITLSEQPVIGDIDVNLIKQAVLNLLINAQQAMENGGKLHISTAVECDRFGRVDVSDTGPGIPIEQQTQIFDAYFSTKKGGTGLGLATTQQIIQEHGGKISVNSQPPNGTTFTILLPLDKR